MALSKDEIQLLKEMIADDSISKQEKDMYREMLGETSATASKPAKKKATKKKSTPKKKKVSESDIDKMKAQIKQRTGKTEEECEKIVEEYRALRKKATTRKKKETATKEKSKQRTTKLKKEGKVIEGTTEKNVEATIDTATKTATKKVDKEITKIEKSTKGEKQVEKKIDQLVKKALASSKKFVSDMAKELSTKSKTDGKTYLLGLRSQIDALLKKYELGGEVFDGSGDSINFGSGGFTSSYNIQDGMISVGNNVKFEEGGDVFDGSGDSVNFAKGGKIREYGVDVDTINDQYRDDLQFDTYEKALKVYNEIISKDTYNNEPLDNVQLVEVYDYDFGQGEYSTLLSKHYDIEYAKGGEVMRVEIQPTILDRDKNRVNKMYRGRVEGSKDWEKESESSDKLRRYFMDKYGGTTFLFIPTKDFTNYAKGGMSQGYNDRLDESLGSRRGTSMSHHQNYKDRRDESKGMETGMGRRAYRGVDTMDNN